jgi:hypothetical protein
VIVAVLLILMISIGVTLHLLQQAVCFMTLSWQHSLEHFK